MSVNCTKCKKNIAGETFECPSCNGDFHPGCAAAVSANIHGRSIQVCKKCANEETKKKMNQGSQGSYSAVANEPNNLAEMAALMNTINLKLDKLDSIEMQVSEITKMKENLSSINQKLDFFIEKCNANCEKLKALDLDVKSIDVRVKQLESNPITADEREKMKRDLEFSMNRVHEVVIFGLSTTLLRDKNSTVLKLAKKLSIKHEDWNVAFMREIRTRRDGTNLLLLHFVSPVFRANWLKAKRSFGDVKCCDLQSDQPDNLIYINQRETVEERRVFFEAKKYAQSQKFHACWMTDGKIYIRKTQDGRPISYSMLTSESNSEDMAVSPVRNTPVSI